MQELRPLAPVECDIVIYQCDEYVLLYILNWLFDSAESYRRCSPITEAYRSAFAFASGPQFAEHLVTRAEYLEGGSNACRRKFKDWRSSDEDEVNLKVKGKGRQRDEGGRLDTGIKTRKTSTSTRRR